MADSAAPGVSPAIFTRPTCGRLTLPSLSMVYTPLTAEISVDGTPPNFISSWSPGRNGASAAGIPVAKAKLSRQTTRQIQNLVLITAETTRELLIAPLRATKPIAISVGIKQHNS